MNTKRLITVPSYNHEAGDRYPSEVWDCTGQNLTQLLPRTLHPTYIRYKNPNTPLDLNQLL